MPPIDDPNRRALVRAGLVLPFCASFLTACAARPSGGKGGTGKAALLLPLTGSQAALGGMMAEAATLAQAGSDTGLTLDRFDTGGTAEGAATAARMALDARAQVIIGPLFSAASGAAARIVGGRIPIISFSNNSQLRSRGYAPAGEASQRPEQLFQIGLEPLQLISAIVRYAQSRGIARIGLMAESGAAWDSAVQAGAQGMIEGGGKLSVTDVLNITPDMRTADMMTGLRARDGTTPDAVLIPSQGTIFDRLAPALMAEGIQPLTLLQGYALPDSLGGAWAAAPDPKGFFQFAELFRARFGMSPGYLTALAHDAVLIARQLAEANMLTAAGLTRAEGFAGVGGRYRFSADGFCRRDLVILADGRDGPEIVEGSAR